MIQNTQSTKRECLDVLIVGAGISGLGMCYNLKKKRPYDSMAIIEGRSNIGGTWDLFKYPGIRSDSDMYTFSYSFKPWTDREYVASADRIKHYLHEMVSQEGINDYIRFEQRVTQANWRSDLNKWVVTIGRSDGSEYEIEAKFFVCAGGYYKYESGYLPEFDGSADFKGEIIHPQQWPEDLDYAGKKVAVIGSGATAVTIVPTMAKKAAKVTMIQRSPSYVISRPASDSLFRTLSRLLPAELTNRIMRLKYTAIQQGAYVFSKKFPNIMRKIVRSLNKRDLGGSADVDVHFKPKYNPWDQRMALVPDADLFNSVRAGKTEIVTDHIDRFTESGILTKSGQLIEADIIVAATGLQLQLWGGIDLNVDGKKVEGNHLTNYKGMMFSQLPNFVWIFGYTNSSWTLKAELAYDYICRLLGHMEKKGLNSVFPYLKPNSDNNKEELVDLKSGYIQRALSILPSQGASFPWRNKDLYLKDRLAIKRSKLDDKVLHFDSNELLQPFYKDAPDMNVATKIEPTETKASVA